MMNIIKYSMSVVYIVMGLFLLIRGWYMLSPRLNHGLGILILAYGIFRAYRVYKEHAENKDPGDNDTDNELTEK